MRYALLGLGLVASCWGCAVNNGDVVIVDARTGACVAGGDEDPRALTAFDDQLSGYGAWSEDATYGTVWTPDDVDFVPYATDGNFADMGGDLVWISDVPWGVATLHHGRWVRCHHRWRWIPGMKYSGAWVAMNHRDGRTSWTPAAPTFVWRRGAAVAIAPPVEPIVGGRTDEALALVPPDLPPTALPMRTADGRVASAAERAVQHVATIGGSHDDDASAFQDGSMGWDPGDFGGGSAGFGGRGGSVASSAHFGATMTSYSSSSSGPSGGARGGGGGHASVSMGRR